MNVINLIDVSGFIYRAFYALPNLTYENTEVGALYGFCSSILKIKSMFEGTMFIAALDSGKKTFRNEIYSDYKANRKAAPEELILQIPLIKESCAKFGFTIIEKPGFEADDLIATCVKKYSRDYKINIISSDKDLMQLLSIENISIYDPIKQKYIIEDDVFKKFGVNSNKVLDVLSLMGDSSDNIPGVSGIGPKTVAALVQEYGSLDGIIKNLENLKPTKKNQILKNEIEKALLSKKLASLRYDVEGIDFYYQETKDNGVAEFMIRYGFKSLAKKVNEQFIFKPVQQVEKIKFSDNKLFIAFEEVDQNKLIYLKDKLEDANIQKISDNIKDLLKLSWNQGIDIKNTLDISVLSYCLVGTKIEHTLKFMSEEYLADDSCDIEKIYNELISKLNETDQYLFFEIENKLVKVLAKMELIGIKVNLQYLIDLKKYFQDKIDDLTQKIHQIAGMSFNVASSKQIAFVLFEKLGFPNSSKKNSTAVEILEDLRGPHNDIASKILNWREYSKLLNTYVEVFIKLADQNSRIHTHYLQTKVNTGRLSSSNPNLQTIPKKTEEGIKIRKCFIAKKGRVLVSFDYSQVELRILAHIANCKGLKSAFKNGLDIHKITASKLFKISEEKVTPEQRNIAKEVNFSIIYGITKHGLSKRLGISIFEASQFCDAFMSNYPEVIEYIQKTEEFAKKHGYVETILGRRCFLPFIKNINKNLVNFAKRQAINAPIQGSSADIIKLAMVKIDEIKNDSFDILLQIHDELVVEIDEDGIENSISLIKNVLENVFQLDVPLIVDSVFYS